MIDKKILWGLLAVFVSFDCIYSYLAIVYHGMREWNPIAAFFVSISPLYYFLSIPLTLASLYFVTKFVGWVAFKTEKEKKERVRKFTESLALNCVVLGWALVATFYNFWTFANGFVNPPFRYNDYLIVAILILVSYALYASWKFAKKEKMKFP